MLICFYVDSFSSFVFLASSCGCSTIDIIRRTGLETRATRLHSPRRPARMQLYTKRLRLVMPFSLPEVS